MSIYFQVAELTSKSGPKFAVLKIDTARWLGDGCEAIVVSLHHDRTEADKDAAICRRAWQ